MQLAVGAQTHMLCCVWFLFLVRRQDAVPPQFIEEVLAENHDLLGEVFDPAQHRQIELNRFPALGTEGRTGRDLLRKWYAVLFAGVER